MQRPLETTLTTQTVLGELPYWDVSFDIETHGVVVAKLFEENPQVPGVIILKDGVRVAALSQTKFLRTIGRPFGIEIFYGRPLSAFVDASDTPMLALSPDSSIQGAVERCLSRSRSEMYEPFLLDDANNEQVRMIDFRTLIMAASQVSHLRNQQMDRILTSVGEGLLIVDTDYVIGHEYSKVLESIFDTNHIAGRSLLDLLGEVLDEKTCAETRDYLDVLFNPRMIDRLIESISPIKEVEARFKGENGTVKKVKHFSIRFRRLKVGSKITQVLMRVDDITRSVNLALELEKQAAEADVHGRFFGEVLQSAPEELAAFIRTFDRYVVESVEWVQPNFKGLPAPDRVNRIYGLIHALKGEAGLLKLKEFRLRLHRFEEDVRRIAARDIEASEESLKVLLPGLVELTNLSEETKDRLYKLRKLANAFEGLEQEENSSEEQKAPMSLEVVSSLERLVSDLAKDLNRDLAFYSATPEEMIPEGYRELLREVCLQLARNSLFHGLESPEERLRLGKPIRANLQFAVRPTEDGQWIEAVFQDDGRGLNIVRIREKLRVLGWPEDHDPADAIFAAGFSTAEETTMEAGRGVGLDYVKRKLEEAGGIIRVHHEPDVYCAFQILLPALNGNQVTSINAHSVQT